MQNFFGFAFLITTVLLIISLIKPGLLNRVIKREVSRKGSSLSFGAILIILLVLIGVTTPKDQKTLSQSEVKGTSTQELTTASPVVEVSPTPTPTPTPTIIKQSPSPVPTPATTYVAPQCSNGTYVNSAGNTVCSPEYAPSQPSGASAQCRDGTYSYSQSRSGTCSHHGGVARWL